MGLSAQGVNVLHQCQEFFGRKQVTIEEVVDARKEALDADRAWALLQVARAVTVARGKGFVRFDQVAKQ